MTQDFATALNRAMTATRNGDPGAATAIIQSALTGGTPPTTAPASRTEAEAEADCGCGPCAGAAAAEAPQTARPAGFGARSFGGHIFGGQGFGGLSGLTTLPGMEHLPGGSPRAGATATVPDGGRVETRRIGGREVRLFLPAAPEGGYAGLVLMLHGCTQSPEDFAAGTRMDHAAAAAGFAVAYPGQTGAHNAQSCWNWFRPQDQAGGEAATLATIAETLAAETGTTGRVYAAGLSAGGAMAAILAEARPDLFAAVGVHSGLPAGAASDVVGAFAAMRGERPGRALAVPGIVFHGTADGTVSPRNARALLPGGGVATSHEGGGRRWTHETGAGGELWLIEGAGHAWSGGDRAGSYADPTGPDAAAEMLRFFAETGA